jgi:putative addiction module component (TIGR02574 family)
MAATTTPENPEIRELIDRAMKLEPADRETIAMELLDSVEAAVDEAISKSESWQSAIARRSEEVASGNVTPLTRDESEAQVREAIRKLGAEL